MAAEAGPEPSAGLPVIEKDPIEVLVHSRHYIRWKQIFIGLLVIAMSLAAAWLALFAGARVAVAAVGTIIVCVGIFLFPQVGFWLYFFLALCRPQEIFWGLSELRISLAVAAVALFAWIITTGLARRPFLRASPLTWGMLALAAVVLLSGIVNGGEFERVIEFCKILLMALATASYLTKRSHQRGLVLVMLTSFTFLMSWGLYQHFIFGLTEIHGPGIDGQGYLYDRNAYAMFILMGIPFYWYLGRKARGPKRVFLLSLIPLAAYTVLLTSSRGGLLGLVGIAAALGWNSKHRIPATVFGLLLMAGFYVFFAPSALKDRAGTIVEYEDEASAMGRINSWKTGALMMAANPVLGVGPDRYVASYGAYSNTYARQAHNSWVQAGAEYGLLGLSLYAFLVWVGVRKLLRLRRDPDADDEMRIWADILLASLAGYLVCGLFLSMEVFEPFYLYLALIVGFEHQVRRRRMARIRSAYVR